VALYSESITEYQYTRQNLENVEKSARHKTSC